MNILISGTTGYIGEHLISSLSAKSHQVHAVVRQSSDTTFLDQNRVPYVTFTGECSDLISYISENKIKGVIHLASLYLTNHTEKDIENLISSNVLFGTQLLECSTQSGIEWFINTGTFWQHYNNHQYSPVNLYAATKQAFQVIAQYYIENSDINFVTLQLSDTYGPGDKRKKVIALWNQLSKTDETLDMSAGEQILDMCYIDDVIDAFMLLATLLDADEGRKYSGKIFGISNHEKVTLKELAEIFESISHKKLHINWGKRPYRPREVMKPWNKAEIVPGWSSKTSLKNGILRTVEWDDNENT